MCGDNVLKIDVKKTLENGGESGVIEESAKVKLSYAPTSMSNFIMFELEVAEKEKKTSFLFYRELNHLTFLRIKGKSCRE